MFDRKPIVYLVGKDYQIIFNTQEFGIAWVEVNGVKYPDEKMGLLRSQTNVHRTKVPCAVLDAAKEYTVCFRSLPERRPYFPELGPLETQTYAFRPIDWSDGLQIAHIGDSHSHIGPVVEMGRCFGDKLDLLIMNGDIPAESKNLSDVLSVFDIAGGITGGERPVVFARGNHDTRGKYALEFLDYIGTDDGNTYFTFRTGSLWGIILDCGEDKLDTDVEYGGLVCCQAFRRRQTEFLKKVVEDKANEYEAEGVKTRIAICHVPFPTDALSFGEAKFDIEHDVFAEWTKYLNLMHIDCMLSAHMHTINTYPVGSKHLRYGAGFPVIVGTEPHWRKDEPQTYTGTTLEIKDGKIGIRTADDSGNSRELFSI